MSPSPIDRHARRGERRWSRRWALLAAIAVLAALPRLGAAESESEGEIDRWVPAFSIFFDAVGSKAHGEVTSGEVLGPPLTEGGCLLTNGTRNGDLCPPLGVADTPRNRAPRKIQPDDAGSDTNVAPLVGGSLELMTPRLFEPLLSPRLFAHVDAAAAFGFERNLAGTGAPGEFEPPQDNRSDNIPEEGITGQGTRTKIQLRHLVLSGGAGVAFSLELFERRLRIKPSFEYMRQEIDLIGSVRRAVKLRQRSTAPNTVLKPEEFRLISLSFTDKETLDGFGPGLELEADTVNLGPFLMSVYAMGRGYYYPSNRDFSFTETNEFGETASWRVELDPWSWRSGIGVRFRWVP